MLSIATSSKSAIALAARSRGFNGSRLRAQSSIKSRNLHAAIIGSGPAGFYAADELFRCALKDVKVDMYEKLPTPYGLVRYGVAPDHPEVKAVEHIFHNLALRNDFNFVGNVTVGRDVSVEELKKAYDVVILAYGAEHDRKLGIPGENLKGVHSAREFVEWYNSYALQNTKKEAFDLSKVKDVVVIGNGNVAVDVARILLKSPSELEHTDISENAIEALKESKVRRVALVGRRGPVQAAFTTSELRELLSLGGGNPVAKPPKTPTGAPAAKNAETDKKSPSSSKASYSDATLTSKLEGSSSSIEAIMRDVNVEKAQTVVKSLPDRVFMCTDADEEELKDRPVFRKFDLLKRLLSVQPPTEEELEARGARSLELFFLRSPVEFIEDPQRPGEVGAVKFEHTLLSGEANKQSARGMGFYSEMKCNLAFTSIGYSSKPMPGLLFDHSRGIIPNNNGRVTDSPGFYACGWIRRGPSGIIGSNKFDAEEVVASIVSDFSNHPLSNLKSDPISANRASHGDQSDPSSLSSSPLSSITSLLASRNVTPVSFHDWLILDQAEVQRGASMSKPREKVKSISDMLQIIRTSL